MLNIIVVRNNWLAKNEKLVFDTNKNTYNKTAKTIKKISSRIKLFDKIIALVIAVVNIKNRSNFEKYW